MQQLGPFGLARASWRPAIRCPMARVLLTATLGLAALCATALSAQAQTASQVTPGDFQPRLQRLSGSVVFSGQPGLVAPQGADRLSVTIRDVAVENARPALDAATQALRARLTGRPVAVSEIFAAAAALEAAYVDAGFVLTRVVLPAQSLRNGGTLKLVVVDGFVERIDTSAAPERIRPRLDRLTADLVGKRGLTLAELERRLLLAGDTFGVALGSALSTGQMPGGTVIILDPTYRGVTGFVGFDNSGSGALGSVTLDAGVEANGLLGMGEVLYLRGSGYPGEISGDNGLFSGSPRLRSLAAGAVVPLNADGLAFNLEATDSRSSPDTPGTDTKSVFQRVSARVYYPVVRSRDRNLTTQLSMDIQRDRFDALAPGGTVPIYEDRNTVLRLATDGFQQLPNGFAELGVTLSLGVDALGARSAAEAARIGVPLSRAGSDASFTKAELRGRLRYGFTDAMFATLSARAQLSFGEALPTSEQIGIAKAYELSSFDEGAISGDSGFVVRAEVARRYDTAFRTMPVTVQPYAFAALGAVHRERPAPGEAGTVRASSYGVGVDAFLSTDKDFSGASLRMEVASGSRNDGENDGFHFSIIGSYRF